MPTWLTPLRVAFAVATVKLGLHFATLTGYGYFRDELYYLACRERLAFGYVDHPPLSIVLLRLWTAIAGDSLAAIHIVPALMGTITIVVTALLVIELGGGVVAVLVACVALLAAPARLGFDQYYSMNAIDGVVWATAAWFALRATERGGARNWLALGAVLGLGVLNKWSVLWLGAGLAVGVLLTARDVLRTRWPWLAAAVAVVIALPNFVWQAAHDWPTLEFMNNALAHKYVRQSPLALFGEAAMMMNPAIVPLWATGVVAPWFAKRLERGRLSAVVFVTSALIVVAARGKAEYLVASFPLVLAPGAVAWEIGIARFRRRAAQILVLAGALGIDLVLGALAVPFALPILPIERFVAYQEWLGMRPRSSENKELGRLPQKYADMHGWPQLVHAAELAYGTLSEHEKAGVTIWALTGGYGPAAAIDVLGARVGLPHAISSHNSYWLWGWGRGDGETVIVLGDHPRMRALFDELTLVTTVECGDCMPYENHKPVFVGRRMRKPFAAFWNEAKRFE